MDSKGDLSFLGAPLKSPEVGIFQEDPFVTTMFGYIHHCLYEISRLLNKVVVFTYKKEAPFQQKYFFLCGFEQHRGYSKKLYGDPEVDSQGLELKWLLKNMRWHLKKYAENLNMYDDVLDDLTGFLFDTVMKASLGSSYLTEVSCHPDLLNDCIEVGEELLEAIEESQYYESLKLDAIKTKQKFEAINKLVNEYQSYICIIREAKARDLDSQKTLNFVQNTLVKQLQQESEVSDNGVSRKPLTNLVSTSLMPRCNYNEDSGIVSDIENLSTTPISSQFTTKHGSTSTPCKANSKTIGMDTSMVIVDTQVLRNKQLEQIKHIPQIKDRKGSSDGEMMDGSFVLV